MTYAQTPRPPKTRRQTRQTQTCLTPTKNTTRPIKASLSSLSTCLQGVAWLATVPYLVALKMGLSSLSTCLQGVTWLDGLPFRWARGGRKSGARLSRTDPFPLFLRARVSWGGVPLTIEQVRLWFSPALRRTMAKRRLERVARDAGASRAVAEAIVANYFKKPLKVIA